MLANRNSVKKNEKVLNRKIPIKIDKQSNQLENYSAKSTINYPDRQIRKNFNLKSEKKLKLHEEFKAKEKEYFKMIDVVTLKEKASGKPKKV